MHRVFYAACLAAAALIGAHDLARADTVKFFQETDHSNCGAYISPTDKDSPAFVVAMLQVASLNGQRPVGVFKAMILLFTPNGDRLLNKISFRIVSAQLSASGRQLNIPHLSTESGSDTVTYTGNNADAAAMLRALAKPPIALELVLDTGASWRYELSAGLSDSDAQSLDRCLATLSARFH